MRVVEHTTVSDPFGISISGRAEFQGRLSIPGKDGELFTFVNDETDPPFDPARRDPVFDLSETSVDFELFVPRVASATIAVAAGALSGNAGFQASQAVLTDWDAVTADAPPSDYPAAGFTLDLLVNAPTLRPPGLIPATMTDEGLLIPIPATGPGAPGSIKTPEVTIGLPKLRFRIAHDVAGDGKLHFDLLSAGAEGLDDPTDLGTGEFVTMTPPHALIGQTGVGFGFRSATLDLSQSSTPPDVLSHIGVGDDWTGLYLPELRFFIAGGANGFAYEFGATDFLWGFGAAGGISGDFEGAIFDKGGGELKVSARFFDPDGRSFGLSDRSGDSAKATLPPLTRMVVDIEGGRAPFTAKVAFDGGVANEGRLFAIDLSTKTTMAIAIDVVDTTSGTPQHKTLAIAVQRGDPRTIVVTPGTIAEPTKAATIAPASGTNPLITIKEQNDRYVTLTTDPPSPDTVWRLDGGAETTPRASFSVEVIAGTPRQVAARLPGKTIGPTDAYFYFDHPNGPDNGSEGPQILGQASQGDEVWSTRAVDRLPAHHREAGGHRPLTEGSDVELFGTLIPSGSTLTITGFASYENKESELYHNYYLARRRAVAAHQLLEQKYGSRFTYLISPAPDVMAEPDGDGWKAEWMTHVSPNDRDWWKATVSVSPDPSRPERASQVTVSRDASAPATPDKITVYDPPAPKQPQQPDWFRSAKAKLRMLEGHVIALEIDGEIDIATASEQQLSATGQLPAGQMADVKTLKNGQPLAPGNPGDGIIAFKFLIQENETTGETVVSLSIGADPSDKDGLAIVGNAPGAARADREFGRNLLAAYISFWPMLVKAANRDVGAPVNAVISGAELAIPAIIAALPWFRAERVILWGGELLSRWQVAGSEGNIFLDLQADWSISIPSENDWLVSIPPESPLSVRYKAIGFRLADLDENQKPITPRYDFRPVFDSSRGYTIDVGKNGGVKVRPPLDKIMKVLAARLSRINPLTLEVELGMGVDFGVVTFDTLGVRVYLDEDRVPEITAIGASVDIPGALTGSGYLKITPAEIAGDIDLTVTPIGLRVSSQLAIANIPKEEGGPATGLYVGMDIVLPVGIPLGNTGLGLLGFRALFGMHYARSAIGADKAIPSLEWLKAAEGKPNRLNSPQGRLWVPKVDHWAFGAGVLIGTMEGGFIINLDGTLLLELPGPDLIIAMNARFLSPPPSVDSVGQTGGILAVIEITPAHVAIGIYATYKIERLIDIKIPAEAYFETGNLSHWHFYLGARPDIPGGPGPAVVRVLNIVDGTGYLMISGTGFPKYDLANLPAISGFGIGIGAGASFVWGNVDIGLYLKVGGGFDAVVGFDPIIIAGTIKVVGELRLFIVSVGADASLTVTVRQQPGDDVPPNLSVRVDGKACGHVDFFFFEVSDCVSISFGSDGDPPPVPDLIKSMSLKSHSPALVVGTGVDRPIDASLGDAFASATLPDGNAAMPVVPIDSIPVIAMTAPPLIDGASFMGVALANPPNLPPNIPPDNGFVNRSGQKYLYKLQSLALERIAGDGTVLPETLQGSVAPIRWWTQQGAAGDPSNAQLALLTWDLDPATKAIETSDTRTETIRDRWGDICDDAAPPAAVLWTFRFERLGPDASGWSLAGIPWPDPDKTKRSQEPDPTLLVHERWRSGVPWVDAARGVLPAVVVGGPVVCQRRTRPIKDVISQIRIGGRGAVVSYERNGLQRDGRMPDPDELPLTVLLRSDDLASFRIPDTVYAKAAASLAVPRARDQSTVFSALARGDEISRADAFGAISTLPAATARDDVRQCEARVLQSPLLDDGTLVRFGDPDKAGTIKEILDEAGATHGPLNDVVVLQTGSFAELRLLLFVPAIGENRKLAVRTLDAKGDQLTIYTVSQADYVPPRALPPHWTDSSGPWAADVADVVAYLASEKRLGRWKLALVELDGKDADRVEIGWIVNRRESGGTMLPWYLGVIEMLRMSEITRADWDDTQITHERTVVTETLGPASTNNAFLWPDSLYRCTLGWTGERAGEAALPAANQSFWFRTDSAPPARLDSFVLMTSPTDGETHYFGGEPPRIVFATHDVDRLWGAYGQDLKIRFQASSARHPPTAGPNTAAQLTATGALLPAGAAVLSPFEAALINVIEGDCIPSSGDVTRQSVLVIKVPLEPFTDYIMDVVAVPTGSEPDQHAPFVYRRRFSTGGYATLGHFGASLSALAVAHRAVPANAVSANLAQFATQPPMGQTLDEALASCGLDVEGAPRGSQVVVLWENVGGVPQPMAMIVDSNEPMWRSRPIPQTVPDPDGLPGTSRWRMIDKPWLALQAQAGDLPILISQPIAAPGGQRALILFKAGARGKRLRLELVRLPFPEPYLTIAEERRVAVDVTLSRAPWED